MYSDKRLRLLIVVFLILGLIPFILAGIQSGEHEIQSGMLAMALKAIFIGSLIAVVQTIILYKISGIPLTPIWLTISGIVALFVFSTTVAGFFPVVGSLVLVILGWGLSSWLLELPALTGVFVGIVFFAARLVGGVFSALSNIAS